MEQNISLQECQKEILKTFVDHHVLPDIDFNVPYLINNISIPKKSNKSVYFYHINPIQDEV